MTDIDDTHPQVREQIVRIFRAMTPADRFAAMSSMTDFVIDQSRRALVETMPLASDEERLRRWSEVHYGEELTARVFDWLARR